MINGPKDSRAAANKYYQRQEKIKRFFADSIKQSKNLLVYFRKLLVKYSKFYLKLITLILSNKLDET
jgi:hypothetical protein